jgi:anti-sigma regulatory factor (Ser/Thr protein kinase)
MNKINNFTPQIQRTNMNNLIKGDLKKLETFHRAIIPEDITINKYYVNAYSVNDLMRISNQIEIKLELYGVPANKRQKFIIALVEAINNAQQHGYQFAKDKMVVINLFKIGNGYIVIGIESIGEPISMNKINRFLKEDNPLKIGVRTGRGFILMKKLVDVLYVSHYEFSTEIFIGIYKNNEKIN